MWKAYVLYGEIREWVMAG